MAGFYADVPAHRFALDIDGTVFKRLDAAKTVLSDASTAATLIADTDTDYYEAISTGGYSGDGTHGYFVLVFPELRNIDAMFVSISGAYADSRELEYSSDTTDGLDGTWTVATANWPSSLGMTPHYRNEITAQPITNAKALRFGYGRTVNNSGNYQFRINCMHLYGSLVGGQNPDRLRFWHNTLDQEAGPAHLDFGDMPLGTQKTIQVRIKNNSSTSTAASVSINRESASYAEVAAGLEFSPDGSSYFSTLNIGDLAPGAVSSLLYIRRRVDAGEAASVPKVGRIVAAATSWS